MKKLTLTIVCAMAMTGAAFAQGYVNWAPNSPDVTFGTNSLVYSPLFGGGNAPGTIGSAVAATGLTSITAGGFDYALLTTTTVPTTDTTVWDGTWTGATGVGGAAMTGVNGTALPSHAGWVTAGTVNGASGTGVQVNWANGTTQSVVLVGWSANLGTSWVTVSNELANWSTLGSTIVGEAFFGETTIGSINPTAASPGDTIFLSSSAPLATGTPIFSLNTPMYLLPVPEPATMALAGLGGLGLLLFRRRRQ
jgi:hypothetical protein